MDTVMIVFSIGSALGVFAFFFRRLEKKIDRTAEEQRKRADDHWEYESTMLTAQMADHDITMKVTDYAIAQGCNGNTKDLRESAQKANSDLKKLIQKRATKNV